MKKLIVILLVTLLGGALWAQQSPTKKAYLGVMATELDEALISHLKLDKDKSFIIRRVVKNTPADKAGLKKFDIILKINNEEVDSTKPLSVAINSFKPDDKINLALKRAGEDLELEVTLGESAPTLSLAEMRDRVKILNKNNDVRIQILEKMDNLQEIQKKFQESFGNKMKINEDFQKMLEEIAKNNIHNHFKLNGSMSTVMSSSDGDHNVTITIKDGNKSAVVRDSQGKVIFEGDINTEVEIEAIPEEIRQKVKNVEKKVQILPKKQFH